MHPPGDDPRFKGVIGDGVFDAEESDLYDREDDGRKAEGTDGSIRNDFSTGVPTPSDYETVHFFVQTQVELKNLKSKPDVTLSGKAKIDLDKLVEYKYK